MANNITVNYENSPCYEIILRNNFGDLISKVEGLRPNKYNKICIVSDSNVSTIYLEQVKALFESYTDKVENFVFEAGEASKSLNTVTKLYEHLILKHFDRSDLLVALGGGVVGDLTGFTASTYLRGIDFIQMPTTLLSQVDSSIGGKTGVDFDQYKNMVGAFYMPRLVYINISTLKTLPKEQFICGMGEVVKHGLIQDKEYYDWMKENATSINALSEESLEEMVYRSCEIKRHIVEIDPKEKSIRGYLNFGHTLGHAIEKLSDFKLYHGQCVSIGTVAASYISYKRGMISEADLNDIIATLSLFGLPVKHSDTDINEIIAATKSDKKVVGDKIKFIVLDGIGNAVIDKTITDDEMKEALEYIK